jgi:hypothetical protein
MPFIHIKSLPLSSPGDITEVLRGITRDFAEKTGIGLMHLHATWEFYPPGHYAKGDTAPAQQPEARHPIIVDLLTPDFNDAETIRLMLKTIAESIATRLPFPIDNIFINHRRAHSGMVFDDGKIVEW